MEAFVLFWFVFAFAPAILASRKGRSAVGWFLLALLISPVLTLIFVAVLPDLNQQKDLAGRVPCPFCKELIKREAVRCPHCRSDIKVERPAADEHQPTAGQRSVARRLGIAVGKIMRGQHSG